jgi:hypothetical protein
MRVFFSICVCPWILAAYFSAIAQKNMPIGYKMRIEWDSAERGTNQT